MSSRTLLAFALLALAACSSSDDKKTSSSSSSSGGGGGGSSSGSSSGGGSECTSTDQCPLLSCTCGGLSGAQVQRCTNGVCAKNCGDVAGCQ